jgi:hypothetical protein
LRGSRRQHCRCFTIPLAAFLVEKLHDLKDMTDVVGGLILANLLLFWVCLKLTDWWDHRPPGSAVR